MIRDIQLITRRAWVGAVCAASLIAWSLVACGGPEPAPTPVAVLAPDPTPVAAAVAETTGGLSPELTRRAADTLRQRDHMATLLARRPTATPVPGEELNVPPPGRPAERGVWWYKPGAGDHSGAALLASHPYGPALDLLDGRMGGDHYPKIAAANRALMLDGLIDGAAELLAAAEPETAVGYSRGQIGLIIRNAMDRSLAWEVASTSAPYVRVWTDFDWDRRGELVNYRVGAMGVVGVQPPDAQDPMSYQYVGVLEQVPLFSHYSVDPVIERVSSER